MRKTTIILIYFLSFYIILQFVWWGYHLFQLNEKVLSSSEEITKKYWMIIGEGIVFFSILLFGIIKLMKSVKKEIELNRQKNNFLLSVTHELKTPLAAVKLNLQTLKKRELDRETQQKLLSKSEAEVARLENIVNNILETTRLENPTKVLEKIDFNLTDLIQKEVDNAKANLGADHIFEMDMESIDFKGDPGLFRLVISNLLENAIKYSEKGSTVTISLKKEDRIELIVKDKGIGIPKSEQAKIFNKFYRSGNEEVRQTKGTGLGLYLVRNLVSEYNGTITLNSTEGKGTEIKIKL